LLVGSHHDIKSSLPKFLGSHFEMMATAENSWPTGQEHLQQQDLLNRNLKRKRGGAYRRRLCNSTLVMLALQVPTAALRR